MSRNGRPAAALVPVDEYAALEEAADSQGSPDERRFAAAYGVNGQVVAAVTFIAGRYLEFYGRMIENAAPLRPDLANVDQATGDEPVSGHFPPASALTSRPTVIVAGHSPTEMRVQRMETVEAAA